MKWTSSILSVLFILLSCLPCADIEGNNSMHTVVEKSSSNHNQDNDSCSPFCFCNCCNSQIFAIDTTIKNLDFVIFKKFEENKIPEYKSILASNFFGSIWQPPQIV
ncbi:DUF6660 family protein [Flavobacterium sp. IMCC34518]|uniref:DUF6660 family protein n=1 Tax=Flavobacterium sp. IMCC34518 TaxID=3003623 RepID=UPI0032B12CFD